MEESPFIVPEIEFVLIHKEALFPTRAYKNDSGWDLYAAEKKFIFKNRTAVVGSGIGIHLPPGFEAQVRPRSSMNKKGLVVLLGTIDNGYEGEIGCTILNATGEDVWIEVGQKIAQIVPMKLSIYEMDERCKDGENSRGDRGFGSSGS